MDKKKLLGLVAERIEKDLQQLKDTAAVAADAATNEESQPENQYDTRALEASYLAGAQSKRVAEIEKVLVQCRQVQVRAFKPDEEIANTALVQVDHKGKKQWLFVLGLGYVGGMHIPFANTSVQIVTAASPLGEALIGAQVSDIITVEAGPQDLDYEILQVL